MQKNQKSYSSHLSFLHAKQQKAYKAQLPNPIMISPKHSHATKNQNLQSLPHHMQTSETDFTSAPNHNILQT
jgi:hypothetical protein